jgi:hypothetical protein
VNIKHKNLIFIYKTDLHLPDFLYGYRIFHSTLFAICIVLVFILYSFIYNAIYQRRRTRTKKFSTYRRILQSYLINNEKKRRHIDRNSLLTYICCYCCHRIHNKSSRQSKLHQSLNKQERDKYFNNEQSCIIKYKPEQIVLEVNGARGKRFSAISMTSMTYFTSGVWDDTSPTNLMRSRINSLAAVTYCGTEHSSTSRPSTSTEDSFDQTNKISNTLSQLRSVTPPNSTHLTVPGQQTVLSNCLNDNQSNEIELLGNGSQSNSLLHPLGVRKASNTLSIRQQQPRPSEGSVHQRKVSFSMYFKPTLN